MALAHAKVNLDLRVLGTRADGFHELRTVFQTIDLHDTLTCVAARRVRAALPHVRRTAGRLQPGVARGGIALEGARAGGGASRHRRRARENDPNGGGAWRRQRRCCRGPRRAGRLWGGVPVTLLREVASGIGADVAFFLSGGTALGLGRGEEIYPLVDLPPHWVVVVRPPFGVSTAEAYAWYDEDRTAGLKEPRELQILPVPWPSRAAQMVNDLEPPVVRRHPEISALKAALKEAGALAAAMSGSGSAVFGLFRSRSAAARTSSRCRGAAPGRSSRER